MELLLDRHAALGTAWWVEANLTTTHDHTALATALRAHLTQFEERYSRFRTDSLISRLNNERSLTAPDTAFQALLTFGQSLFTRTNGTFNFLLGDVLTARGYGARRDSAMTEAVLSGAAVPNPATDLIITPEHVVITNGSVDLGGFGKGYVIDELAEILRIHGVTEFLINGGGDLYATDNAGEPFTIYLEHPTKANTYLGSITLHHQGFAASSPFKRVWKQGDTEHNHIVGATDYATFLTAPTAALADAFATAALLLPEAAITQLAQAEQCSFACYKPATNDLTQYRMNITVL